MLHRLEPKLSPIGSSAMATPWATDNVSAGTLGRSQRADRWWALASRRSIGRPLLGVNVDHHTVGPAAAFEVQRALQGVARRAGEGARQQLGEVDHVGGLDGPVRPHGGGTAVFLPASGHRAPPTAHVDVVAAPCHGDDVARLRSQPDARREVKIDWIDPTNLAASAQGYLPDGRCRGDETAGLITVEHRPAALELLAGSVYGPVVGDQLGDGHAWRRVAARRCIPPVVEPGRQRAHPSTVDRHVDGPLELGPVVAHRFSHFD